MSQKRFHRSDRLFYEFLTIDLDNDGNPVVPFNIKKSYYHVHASNGVSWQDIRDEILQPQEGTLDPVLKTVTVDYPEFVVSLTLSAALKYIDDKIMGGNRAERYSLFLKGVEPFCKELISIRDDLLKEKEALLKK